MAFTEDEEKRLRAILDAYDNGVAISELPYKGDPSPSDMVEITDWRNGESYQTNLADVLRPENIWFCHYWGEASERILDKQGDYRELVHAVPIRNLWFDNFSRFRDSAKVGDRLIETASEEVDADGNPITDYPIADETIIHIDREHPDGYIHLVTVTKADWGMKINAYQMDGIGYIYPCIAAKPGVLLYEAYPGLFQWYDCLIGRSPEQVYLTSAYYADEFDANEIECGSPVYVSDLDGNVRFAGYVAAVLSDADSGTLRADQFRGITVETADGNRMVLQYTRDYRAFADVTRLRNIMCDGGNCAISGGKWAVGDTVYSSMFGYGTVERVAYTAPGEDSEQVHLKEVVVSTDTQRFFFTLYDLHSGLLSKIESKEQENSEPTQPQQCPNYSYLLLDDIGVDEQDIRDEKVAINGIVEKLNEYVPFGELPIGSVVTVSRHRDTEPDIRFFTATLLAEGINDDPNDIPSKGVCRSWLIIPRIPGREPGVVVYRGFRISITAPSSWGDPIDLDALVEAIGNGELWQ